MRTFPCFNTSLGFYDNFVVYETKDLEGYNAIAIITCTDFIGSHCFIV